MEELGGLRQPDPAFWRGKRVLVTGHTGFKGTWLTSWLRHMEADVSGLSLPPSSSPSMYEVVRLDSNCVSMLADIRDTDAVLASVSTARPEFVFHLAAQSLVRVGIDDPSLTFSTNVMGTVNLLEALVTSASKTLRACVVVTSDKVYRRVGDEGHFSEDAPLGGDEPYSASKAAQEMVVAAYRQKMTMDGGTDSLVTARGGNVVGGGDFSPYRLVPDIWRSCQKNDVLKLRMPEATRPWQHVLDCLSGYVLYAESIAKGEHMPGSLNFGPKEKGIKVREVSRLVHSALEKEYKEEVEEGAAEGEHRTLSIDSSLARKSLGWKPRLEDGFLWDWTAKWYSEHFAGSDMAGITSRQIEQYMSLENSP